MITDNSWLYTFFASLLPVNQLEINSPPDLKVKYFFHIKYLWNLDGCAMLFFLSQDTV